MKLFYLLSIIFILNSQKLISESLVKIDLLNIPNQVTFYEIFKDNLIVIDNNLKFHYWNLNNGNKVDSLDKELPYSLRAYNKNNQIVVFDFYSGEIFLEIPERKKEADNNKNINVVSLQLSSEQKKLAAFFADGQIRIWDIENKNVVPTLISNFNTTKYVLGRIKFIKNDSVIIVYFNGVDCNNSLIGSMDINDGKILYEYKQMKNLGLQISVDGNTLLLNRLNEAKKPEIIEISTKDGSILRIIHPDFHNLPTVTAYINNNILSYGNNDNDEIVYFLTSDEKQEAYFYYLPSKAILGIGSSPSDNFIYFVFKNKLQFLDSNYYKSFHIDIQQHHLPNFCIHFSDDESIAVIKDYPWTVFNTQTKKIIGNLSDEENDQIKYISISRDNKYIAYRKLNTNSDNELIIYRILEEI